MSAVLVGFTALLNEAVQIGVRGNLTIALNLFKCINGLWEASHALAAPGSNTIHIQPHDHTDTGGGVSLPRGVAYSWDTGDAQDTFTQAIAAPDTWTDLSGRTIGFKAYVSDGIGSDIVSVVGGSTKCFLEAWVCIECTNGTIGDSVRVRNLIRGENSSSIAVTTTAQWLQFTDIPCTPGSWNDFAVQVATTSAGTSTFYGYAFIMAEIRDTSQPNSSASTTFSSVALP